MGTTFEKHYTCTNMSTSSRSVMYTGTHITDTKMIDNVDFPWQQPLSEDVTTVGDRLRTLGYYTAFKGKFHMGSEDLGTDTTEVLPQQQNAMEGYGFSDFNADGDVIS